MQFVSLQILQLFLNNLVRFVAIEEISCSFKRHHTTQNTNIPPAPATLSEHDKLICSNGNAENTTARIRTYIYTYSPHIQTRTYWHQNVFNTRLPVKHGLLENDQTSTFKNMWKNEHQYFCIRVVDGARHWWKSGEKLFIGRWWIAAFESFWMLSFFTYNIRKILEYLVFAMTNWAVDE